MNDSYDKTFLGIDYGSRRVGISKSDPTGLIASPITTLVVKSESDCLNKLIALIDEYSPDGLVFGYPLHDSGDRSEKCEEIDKFITKVETRYDGPIHRCDERYSSVEAHAVIHAHGKRTGSNKARIDKIAAVIILQRFLDESNFNG